VTLRAKLIALIALLAIGGAIYAAWAYHERSLGSKEIEARDAQAAVAALQRENEQLRRDAKTNEDVANALQAEKDRLAAALADPPVIRVCEPASSPTVPAKAPAPRKPRQAPAAGGSSASVSTGAPAGVDIGPGVQLISRVADRLAAQERALLQREAALR